MAADAPEISVVIPLYNKANSVSRAIESVLGQQFRRFELIVVDDGSTDGSIDAVHKLSDPRIRLIQQPNQGVSAARNLGIDAARTAFIAFLDADDAWQPTFLTAIRSLIARFPDAGAYATGYFVKNPGEDVRLARFCHVPQAAEGGLIKSYFKAAASASNPVWSSAVCVPKTTFAQVGKFPEGVRLYEDLHLWSRIALGYPIAYSAQPQSIYFRDAENRACNEIVPDRGDMQFADVINAALLAGTLDAEEARAARAFINRYALLNAFKSVLAGCAAESRQIAASVSAHDAPTLLRKYFVLALARLPNRLVGAIWKLGKICKQRWANRH